jgi:hypothetical protein
MAVIFLTLRDGRALLPGSFLALISVRRFVDSKAIMQLQGVGKFK